MVLLTRRFHGWACRAVGAALVVSATGGAAGADTREDAIKAAFLYNFTKFIDWPGTAFSDAAAPFTVCVVASETFRRHVEAIMDREQIRGRPIRVAVPLSDDDLRRCHLLYFGADESARARKLLPAVRQLPVLTVGEGDRFLDHGGLIAFALVDDRVRFDISKRAANEAGLTVSSKLLRVARAVEGAAP